jgi:HK97 family phage major capsid protein
VGVNLMAGSYIDVLRNAALIGNGPFAIIELNGLTGNIAIPRQTSTVTTYWLAEGATVTESNFAGGQLLFSPKRLVTRNSFTKQLLAQGTPSIEMLVRNDMAQAQAVEEDRVAIQGTGLNGEPIGVINTSGIDASVTFSGNWTQNKSLAFEYALENANVRNGEAVFLTTPLTKSYAKGTVQVASSTFPIYIWMPSTEYPSINGVKGGVVNGYGAYATKNATNRVLYSVWNNNFTRARWAGIDVVVNPYTGDASELIYVTMTQWLDQGLRYPQAASYSTDAPTSPS